MSRSAWAIIGIVALLLLAGGGAAVYVMTRGIRNNNPGNIRKSSDRWLGMAAEQTDSEFVQFVSPEYGIRAMGIILRNYRTRYNLRTLRQLLTRWAPPTENNTEAYIAKVSAVSGIAPDSDVLEADLPSVIVGMISMENGFNPYKLATITDGLALA